MCYQPITSIYNPSQPTTNHSEPERLLSPPQVLTNFVSNAIKYASGSRVTIHAMCTQGTDVTCQHPFECKLPPHLDTAPVSFSTATTWDAQWAIVVAVADCGKGVPEGKLDTIFELYSQVQSCDAKCGSGLGLSICKRLALLMNGAVGVTTAPSRGSVFWIALPGMMQWHDEPPQLPPFVPPPPIITRPVLVVDDDAVCRLITSSILEKDGYEVHCATDGREAWDKVCCIKGH